MTTFIITGVLGLFLSVLGILNMMGNINSLHWYHRQRVTEENRVPFGRLVGSGTLMIGIAAILFGALSFASDLSGLPILSIVGTVILCACVVVGLAISFYGMIKYNKGIF